MQLVRTTLSRPIAFAARKSKHCWLSAVELDFAWAEEADRKANTTLLQEIPDLQAWVLVIQSNLTACKKAVKSICLAKAANFIVSDGVSLPLVTLHTIVECEECGKVLPSIQQLRLHEFKHHGRIRQARKFVSKLNACPASFRECRPSYM